MATSVAIVHDWLTSMRGGERVVESLCSLFPKADLFTLRCDRSRLSATLAGRPMTTSFIDRIARTPLMGGRFRALLPLFPVAVESFQLDGYDLVISSSHCVALGALAPVGALHVAYLHSTMRYVREGQAAYEASVPGGPLGRLAFRYLAHRLRLWDAVAGARPDVMIANSSFTGARIRRYYQRDAEVIPPPIETSRFERAGGHCRTNAGADGDQKPLLVVSALVPNKRVDLAVRAVAGRSERLLVVGEGPERARLERMAGPNVSFLGWVSDQALEQLYAGCRALLHPGVDDFGMVMAEALSAGKPVVASSEGGAADIISEQETGVVFDAPTVESVRAALDRLAQMQAQGDARFDPARLAAHARRYDRATFERRFSDAIERAWRRRQMQTPETPETPVSHMPARRRLGLMQ